MSLEDDFPSFWVDGTFDVDFQITPIRKGVVYICEVDIQKYCLDKQRVREAIERLEKEYYQFGVPDNEEPCRILHQVLKELGL